MGFVLSALQQDPKSFARTLGIEGRIHAVMALGVPAFRYPNYIDRKEIPGTANLNLCGKYSRPRTLTFSFASQYVKGRYHLQAKRRY